MGEETVEMTMGELLAVVPNEGDVTHLYGYRVENRGYYSFMFGPDEAWDLCNAETPLDGQTKFDVRPCSRHIAEADGRAGSTPIRKGD